MNLSADSIIRDKKTGVCRLSAGDSLFKIVNDTYLEGLKEVDTILSYLGENKEVNIMSTDLSFKQDMINFQMDLSVVRGLEYYTGTVMEAETTDTSFWKSSRDANAFKKIKLGSLSGGGRFDKLVSRFLNDDYPSVGISIGLDRILMLLKDKYKDQTLKNPIIICVFDTNYFSKYNDILQTLRSANINSEIYIGDGNLKSQMKYANKRNSPAVIFCGEDEIKSGKITLKNLKSGDEISLELENLTNEIKKII